MLSGKYPLTTTGGAVSFVAQSTFDDKENKKVKKIKKLATVSSTGSLRQYIGGLASMTSRANSSGGGLPMLSKRFI